MTSKSGKMKLFHAYSEAKSREKQQLIYEDMVEEHVEMQAARIREQKKRIAYIRTK